MYRAGEKQENFKNTNYTETAVNNQKTDGALEMDKKEGKFEDFNTYKVFLKS